MKKKYLNACITVALSMASVSSVDAALLLPNSVYKMTLDAGDSSFWLDSGTGGTTLVMEDGAIDSLLQPEFINPNGGNGVSGDGYAGVIEFITDGTGENLTISSFQIDPISTGGIASDAYLYQYADDLTGMSGNIDASGNMSLDLTGRLADLSNNTSIGQMPFNLDSISGLYDVFTTGTTCNLVNCVTGSVVTPSTVPNEFMVTLVSAGELGTDWGGFAGTSYNEVWASQNTITLVGPASTVPVPATVWLFGSGLIGLIGVARRKT